MGKSRAAKRRKIEVTDSRQQEVRNTLATAVQLHRQGHLEQAETLYKVILKIDPTFSDAWHLLGVLAQQVGQNEAACEMIAQAITLNPDVPQYHYNRGVSYQALDDHGAAAKSYQEAVRLKPDYREAFENLGVTLQDMNQNDAAGQAYKRAIEINEASPLAHHNLGTLLKNIGQTEEAYQHFVRALALNPVYAEARWKKAHALLTLGRFSEGWQEYEWRFYADSFLRANEIRVRPFPKWDGASLSGKRILVTAEQGIGDELMFASCFPDIIARAESCVIECDPRLVGLFQRSFPDAVFLGTQAGCAHYAGMDPFDYCIAAGSLPRFFRSSREDFPVTADHLQPDTELQSRWRDELAGLKGSLNVGISWRGGRETRAKEARSIALRQWQDIFGIESANFINLQYGDHQEEIAEFGARLHSFDRVDPLRNLEDFAALISTLDLVISIDNSTVHLAGALGTPVWVLLPRSADWRWGDESPTCVWYASARLFRQKEPGPSAWDAVLGEVRDALQSYTPEPAGELLDTPPVAVAETPEATRQSASMVDKGQALLINDTSAWYHWGCTCTSLAIHEQLRRKWHSVESVPIARTHNLASLPQTIEQFDDEATFTLFRTVHRDIIDRIEDCDAVHVNGEGTLHDTGTAAVGLLYLAYIAKKRFGKAVHIMNHSCYPDDTSRVKEDPAYALYRKVYSEVDHVAVREPVSARLLAEMGIDATTSFDCLPLFLDQHYRRGEEERDKNKSIVIAGSVAWSKQVVPAIGEFIKRAHVAGFRPKVLIGASAYPASDDFRFVQALHPSFGQYFSLINATSESQWLDTIANAFLLVSGRFHHSIAAAFLGTPFIVMESNTPKINGLMEMLELDTTASVSDPDLPATLFRRALECVAAPERALLRDPQKARLRALSLENFPS